MFLTRVYLTLRRLPLLTFYESLADVITADFFPLFFIHIFFYSQNLYFLFLFLICLSLLLLLFVSTSIFFYFSPLSISSIPHFPTRHSFVRLTLYSFTHTRFSFPLLSFHFTLLRILINFVLIFLLLLVFYNVVIFFLYHFLFVFLFFLSVHFYLLSTFSNSVHIIPTQILFCLMFSLTCFLQNYLRILLASIFFFQEKRFQAMTYLI